jgi:hypothetical protein
LAVRECEEGTNMAFRFRLLVSGVRYIAIPPLLLESRYSKHQLPNYQSRVEGASPTTTCRSDDFATSTLSTSWHGRCYRNLRLDNPP